jgi:2-oxoglutarate ferredoxin oxidoreductase subunit alpha
MTICRFRRRISSRSVRAFLSRIDILIPLDQGAIRHVEKRISPQTIILAEKETIGDDFDQTKHKFIDVPFTKTASDIGNKIYSNVVAMGTIAGLFGVELQTISEYVKQFFSAKSEDVVEKNLAAAKEGFNLGAGLVNSSKIIIDIRNDADIKDQILLSGTEAVALGAIAGGCNFISAYPMSPSTGVLVFLAKRAKGGRNRRNEYGYWCLVCRCKSDGYDIGRRLCPYDRGSEPGWYAGKSNCDSSWTKARPSNRTSHQDRTGRP